MEIRDMKELDWPNPMTASGNKRDNSRYYQFHRDHGHDMEECIHLEEEIECLLKQGLLTKAGVINVIVGGIAVGGDSNSARKGYALTVRVCSIQEKARFHQNIIFNEEDLIGVATSHNDTLMIVDDIANFDVKRVLVDGGSAANILTWEAFVGLKFFPKKLKVVSTTLQGFE
ncbi:uncharacterized protein LOC111379153 [Olea europaea var. sylvestris]|uniref:uncharacterized protein LOC111379153 n=1 Tax=Olea europaea var. sylvestris TaxID=158386 RepID=UPI000C1D87EB|nr:uncharacterized protein LOC111379153 [Olea europaea var. sylvestris]